MMTFRTICFFGHNHIDSYCNNLNSVTFSLFNNKYSWLLDTGASLSVIKLEHLIGQNIPFHKHKLRIKGVGGYVISEGFVYLKLYYNDKDFEHKFYVIDGLPCRTHGILGQDFLCKFKCIINFENNTLTLKNNNAIDEFVELPLQMGQLGSNNFITLPPRCESIHYINTSLTAELIVASKQLGDGIFLAGTLVSPVKNKIPIKILNTRDEEVRLSFFSIELFNLDDYLVCNFNKETINADRVKKIFSILKLNYLNREEQISIENICAKYSDVFFLPGDKLGVTNLYQQSIKLKENVTPSYVKPYRLPKSQKAEIDSQVRKMLNDDIIEESQSEWSSPLLLVPKKTDNNYSGTKKWRVVIDYRKLNEKIKDDKFPLPNISEILDSLSGAIYFTHLDLSQGYYQLELDPSSRKYTAFVTDKQYHMKRLPMGLKTSPSAFSRLMTVAMSGLHYDKCLIYLDDLICFGRNLETHNKNLTDIFQRLRKVNLKINPEKCQFLKKQLLYLGHVVSSKGVLPDPEKTKSVQNFPVPSNADETRRFVAFCNYYRKFIPHFADITLPLNRLCRKGVNFEWSNECQNSFLKLKNALVTPPILQYPDFSSDNEFILQTDASGVALGAVLCNKDKLPVAYASRTLNKSELNYPTIEKELLAIVWAVRHFRPYLYGKQFKIMTDHKPLVYLFSINNPSSRLLKFRLTMEEYDYKIEYVKGVDNVAADALSRIVLTSKELKDINTSIMNVMTRSMTRKQNERPSDNLLTDKDSTNNWIDHPRVVEILKSPKNCIEVIFTKNNREMQNKDNFNYVPNKSILYINSNSRSCTTRDVFVKDFELFCREINVHEIYIIRNDESEKFIRWLIDNIKSKPSWTGPRVFIIKGVRKITNNDDKRVIINDFHLLPTSGHAGVRRMLNNIKKYYFWTNMDKDVAEFVKKCDKCQKQKHSLPTKQPMTITTTAESAFDKVFIDLVGPLEKDYYNKSYILTLQCELSKYVEAFALESKSTDSVARSLVENFILRYGIPREIASDRGAEFVSSVMSQVCKLLNIQQTFSSAYHHESIGSLENSHKSLNAFLRIQCDNNPRYWSTWLPYWCFSYNTSTHSETRYTPFELVFGKHCRIPSNLLQNSVEPLYNVDNYPLELKFRLQKAQSDAKCNLYKSKHNRKDAYDMYTKPIKYNKGDLLLIKNEAGSKFDNVYIGPFEVLEELCPNVKILRNGKEEIIHKNRTKLYHV